MNLVVHLELYRHELQFFGFRMKEICEGSVLHGRRLYFHKIL